MEYSSGSDCGDGGMLSRVVVVTDAAGVRGVIVVVTVMMLVSGV